MNEYYKKIAGLFRFLEQIVKKEKSPFFINITPVILPYEIY